MGWTPNLQRLRHGTAAGAARHLIYHWMTGDPEWPPTFRAPVHGSPARAHSGNAYVHLPFCETICPHCPYNKIRFDGALAEAYHEALLREIGRHAEAPGRPAIRTLYFGGGTPTLTPRTLAAAIDRLTPLMTDDAEVAVEVYPADATPDLLASLRDMGVTRISLGVESRDPAVLRRLGRRYSPNGVEKALASAKNAGFEMLDVNLIFGVPGQAIDGFLDDVRFCVAAGADQISAYPLFTFDHTPAGTSRNERLFARADDGDRLRMQRGVSDFCQSAGFERTSVWSYTRTGVRPYTTVSRADYIGFGAGAGSKTPGLATFNTFSVLAYIDASPNATALQYTLSDGQQRADWLYWQIYNTRIDRSAYAARFGRPVDEDFGKVLRLLRVFGMLERGAVEDVLTDRGAIWVHRIQSMFSLNGIDAVWTACKREAWPQAVAVA